MYIQLDRTSGQPLWQQVVTAMIQQMDSGQLQAGDTLPPSRILALELGISRSTVQIAYDELLARGYIKTAGRSGTQVIANGPTAKVDDSRTALEFPDNPTFTAAQNELRQWLTVNEGHAKEIDFRHQEPYIDKGFHVAWQKAMMRALDHMTTDDWGYTSGLGTLSTRLAIQLYLAEARGIRVTPEQIMVTSGAQHSIDLIAQALLSAGSHVAVEDPGFPGARLPLAYRGMQVQNIAVDNEGIVVKDIAQGTKLIFVTPSHQRPTGVVMSVSRRRQLVQFAVDHGAWIVEDDFDGEYRYHGGPLPSLFADAPSHALYIMTFSKVLAPGIRLAVIVGPSNAAQRIAAVQSLTQRQMPIVEQRTLGEFLHRGDFARHVHRQRKVYRERHQALTEALNQYGLDRRFRILGAEAGLHVLLEAERSFNEKEAVQRAARLGVGVYPLAPYCASCGRKGLLLGFAKIDVAAIDAGIARLASVF